MTKILLLFHHEFVPTAHFSFISVFRCFFSSNGPHRCCRLHFQIFHAQAVPHVNRRIACFVLGKKSPKVASHMPVLLLPGCVCVWPNISSHLLHLGSPVFFFLFFFFLLNNSSLSQILIVFLSLKTHIFRCVATYPHTKTLVSFPCTSELTRGQSLRRTVVGWSVIITDYVRVTRKTQRTRHYS